ncbi:hypothetical protein F5884DRAFT_899568 [Xylogone sp. PMI_703]|nr:hypothetical protein F5884DRAFT_899568 [Xylogone sp. PMI_703]
MARRLLCLMTACFLLSIHVGVVHSSMQYCYEDLQVPIHFCLAVETWHNKTSSSTDLLVTFGHQRFREGGWTAVGVGRSMFGALMFIEYTGIEEAPVFSPRHGRGHVEPRPSDALPEIHVWNLAMNNSRWLEASFTCYGYDKWVVVDKQADLQQLIWATNTRFNTDDALVDTELSIHQEHGRFALDMKQAQSHGEMPTIPVIDFTKPNTTEDDHYRHGDTWLSFWASLLPSLHGVLLSFSLTVFFPVGAIIIRSGSSRAFQMHLFFQLTASFLCLVGVSIAGSQIIASGSQATYFREPHVLFGTLLVTLIAIQILLGHTHHQRYKHNAKSISITFWHVNLGRVIVVGGCLNVLLGLRLAGSSVLIKILFTTVSLLDIGIVASLSYIKYKERATMPPVSYEDDIPLLDTAERK